MELLLCARSALISWHMFTLGERKAEGRPNSTLLSQSLTADTFPKIKRRMSDSQWLRAPPQGLVSHDKRSLSKPCFSLAYEKAHE